MTHPRAPSAILLMGPTAAGKTELALQLAKTLPCELISVDSALIYRGMDIGTAKPDRETLRRVPHRLIDICDPSESYSAAQFRTDALRAMAEITTARRIPVLVGGTMLYFRALEAGLAELPAANPTLRAELSTLVESNGLEYLHQKLSAIDPVAAARIHPNDPQRIIRALEIYYSSGLTMSHHLSQQKTIPLPYSFIRLALAPKERTLLHQRIALRFTQMLEQGLVAEVAGLYARADLHSALPSIRTVGYRQIWEHFQGKISKEVAKDRAIVATRQLAKRQLTWLRSWNKKVHWVDSLDKNALQEVLKSLPSTG